MVKKVSVIDTSGFVLETQYNTDFPEIESKKPRITGLATTAAPNTDENKMPNVNDLIKK